MLRSLSLAALVAFIISPCSADAQGPVAAVCGYGSAEVIIDVRKENLEDATTTIRVNVYTSDQAPTDAPTWTRLVSDTTSTTGATTVDGEGCGLLIETNNNNPSSGNESWLFGNPLTQPELRLLTVEFRSVPSDALIDRFTYNVCNPGDKDAGFGFYCSRNNQDVSVGRSDDITFRYDVGLQRILVRTAQANAFAPRTGVSDYLPAVQDSWILPYSVDELCDAIGNPSSACRATQDVFVTRVHGDPETGSFITPQYRDWDMPDHDIPVFSDATGPNDRYVWDLGGKSVRFAAGRQLVVEGEMVTSNAVLTSATASGWHGIWADGADADLTLDGAALLGVSYNDGNDYKKPNSALTVTNGATALLTNRAVIDGAVFAQGVEATTGALVTIEGFETFVRNNDYAGVVAMPGAVVTLRDRAAVTGNLGGGLVASGTAARIDLDLAVIATNEGTGIYATDGGVVQTISAGTGVNTRTVVNDNFGGLDGTSGGDIDLGICQGGVCSDAGHSIAGNDQSGAFFDAHSYTTSRVRAQGNDWAVGSVGCLILDQDAMSILDIAPIIQNGAPCFGGSLRSGSTSAAKSGSSIRTASEGEDAATSGDAAAAAVLLSGALAAAQTADERAGVYGSVRRALAHVQPQPLLADLSARAGTAERGEALRALATADLARGHAAGAAAHADALLGEAAEAARTLLVRAEAMRGDEAAALGHLEALWTLAPESDAFMQAAAVALAAFPEADLDWAGGAAKGGIAAVHPDATPTAALTVWPNPTAGDARVEIPTTEGAVLSVTLYDGLGRRVAVLADGAEATGETFTAALPTAGLAPGVYLVRAVSRGATDAVAVARVTVTR